MKTKTTLQIERAISSRRGKSYLAAITGMSGQYIFARTFILTTATDKAEMYDCRRRGKGAWMESAEVGEGIYEMCDCGVRTYALVRAVGGVCKWWQIDVDRVQAIALLLDDGVEFELARLQTRPAPVAVVAQ